MARRAFAFGITLAPRAKSPYSVDLTYAVLNGILMEINALLFLTISACKIAQ